jgi:ribose transport system substrate-binding protein
MKTTLKYLLAATAATLAMTVSAYAAGPEIVKGPSKDAECFKPLTAETKFFQWPKN